MNYIVFDLEWNQSPDGKRYSNEQLPFEIIEIGAVKLNEQGEITDGFQQLIRPQVYNWIHDSIHEVIHVDYKDLADGLPFVQAVDKFLEWCGPEHIFFTWGNQDLMELQRNMKYYGILSRIPGPVTYYDVQKLFSIVYEDRKTRRSLEYAINYLKISRDKDFHRAYADAYYTAEVLRSMEPEAVMDHSSIDVYQNPKKKKDEIHISYPTYDKFISREFFDREKVMKDREVNSTRCPVCHRYAKRKLRWFMNNSRAYESISACSEHGYVKGRVRIRKTEEGKYYAIKTLRLADMEEAEELRRKCETLRLKRRIRRQSEKEV
jgi:DNA polymerase III epsilon subunit-like protein